MVDSHLHWQQCITLSPLSTVLLQSPLATKDRDKCLDVFRHEDRQAHRVWAASSTLGGYHLRGLVLADNRWHPFDDPLALVADGPEHLIRTEQTIAFNVVIVGSCLSPVINPALYVDWVDRCRAACACEQHWGQVGGDIFVFRTNRSRLSAVQRENRIHIQLHEA